MLGIEPHTKAFRHLHSTTEPVRVSSKLRPEFKFLSRGRYNGLCTLVKNHETFLPIGYWTHYIEGGNSWKIYKSRHVTMGKKFCKKSLDLGSTYKKDGKKAELKNTRRLPCYKNMGEKKRHKDYLASVTYTCNRCRVVFMSFCFPPCSHSRVATLLLLFSSTLFSSFS